MNFKIGLNHHHHPTPTHPPEANIWIEALPNQAKQVNMLNIVDNLDAVEKADVINMVDIMALFKGVLPVKILLQDL